jgi:WD40 repeat protein
MLDMLVGIRLNINMRPALILFLDFHIYLYLLVLYVQNTVMSLTPRILSTTSSNSNTHLASISDTQRVLLYNVDDFFSSSADIGWQWVIIDC